MTGVARTKVPVKDGRSQSGFIKSSQKMQGLVENPDSVFYTEEEVAKHNTEADCWTVYEGRIYDITEYAKVHPG
jgi:cytochrome b involved in lipid metabolism